MDKIGLPSYIEPEMGKTVGGIDERWVSAIAIFAHPIALDSPLE